MGEDIACRSGKVHLELLSQLYKFELFSSSDDEIDDSDDGESGENERKTLKQSDDDDEDSFNPFAADCATDGM